MRYRVSGSRSLEEIGAREGDSVEKGANIVISLLYHYLQNNEADVLILFADNCVGENKSNTM